MPELVETTPTQFDIPIALPRLQQDYSVVGDIHGLKELLTQEPSIFSVLREAACPLRTAFGETRILQARVQNSDDDPLLRIAVQLPADCSIAEAERALDSFDANW